MSHGNIKGANADGKVQVAQDMGRSEGGGSLSKTKYIGNTITKLSLGIFIKSSK